MNTVQTVLDILVDARSTVAKGWTKQAMARDASGALIVNVTNPKARTFDIGGAIERASYKVFPDLFFSQVGLDTRDRALSRLEQAIIACGDERSHYSISRFNDFHTTTHNDVLAVFDRAVEAERAFLEAERAVA